MFGFGSQSQSSFPAPNCPCCQTPMQSVGQHGIRLGGLTGMAGAAAALIGGQLATDGEEAFEKKMKAEIFVCPSCSEISMKYLGGL